MNSQELEDIRANIYADPMHYEDPQCLPDLLKKAVDTLGAIATSENSRNSAGEATQCLRDMSVRAASGIPFGEPAERLYETTLDEDERTGR